MSNIILVCALWFYEFREGYKDKTMVDSHMIYTSGDDCW